MAATTHPTDLIAPAARRVLALLPADLGAATMSELFEAREIARAAGEIQRRAAMGTQTGSDAQRGMTWLMFVRMAITDAIGDAR